MYSIPAKTTPPILGQLSWFIKSNPIRGDVIPLRALIKKGEAKRINRIPAIRETTHLSRDVYGLSQLQPTIFNINTNINILY